MESILMAHGQSHLDVLFVVSTLSRTGPTRQLLNLASALQANGKRVQVCTLSLEPADTLKSEFDIAGVAVRSLALSRLGGLVLAKKGLTQLIRELRPQIVHTQGIRADALGVRLVKAGVLDHHVATLRNIPREDYPAKFGCWRGGLMALQHEKLIRGMNHPVACAEALREELIRLNPRIVAIANAVDTNLFQPATPMQRASMRQMLGVKANEIAAVMLGSLIPRKDPQCAVEAFRQLPSSLAIKLFMVGDGPLRQHLESSAAGLPITFLGNRADIAHLLGGMDLLVSCSRAEGLPNTVLEATASGLPCILSDIAPHKELIGDNTGCGALFRLGDPSALRDAINLFGSTGLRAPVSACRELATSKYSIDANCRRYLHLYESILSHG